MKLFGLIGYPLSHSFSKRYFTEKFDREGLFDMFYELFPLENIQEFPGLILDKGSILKGLNVTIPYKQLIIPYLDELHETAKAVQAVNTILISEGRLLGFNTDVIGFEKTLESCLDIAEFKGKALVLGTGGASKAVQYVLKKRNIPFNLVSRTPDELSLTYEEITTTAIADFPLIINTTPLGMSPAVDTCPELPYEGIGAGHILIDLVYNPEMTLFMRKGKERGARVINGIGMLYEQAEAAWEIWSASF
jgi:shikimate dehydrogenase